MLIRGITMGILRATLVYMTIFVGWVTMPAAPVQTKQPTTQDLNEPVVGLIDDPILLEGWRYLNALEKPVTLWDNRTLTGKDLAQFLIKSQIPVVWGSDKICNGSSCSLLICNSSGFCSYEDGQPGIHPIYLNPGIRASQTRQTIRVAAELAHEIFHRMQPFGPGKVTLFEEYWAYYIDAQVSQNEWPQFQKYDPNNGYQLKQWFSDHTLSGYLKLELYPEGFQQSKAITGSEKAYDKSSAKDLLRR